MENSGYEFEKGRLKAQTEHVFGNTDSKVPKIVMIIPIIFFIFFIVFMILQFTVFNSSFMKSKEDIQAKQQEEAENLIEQQQQAAKELESKISSHNIGYSSGRKATVFINSMLNDAINNNQTNQDKKITVEYKDISTQDVEKIMEIEQMLDKFSEYNVLLGYDEEGFINKITIKD